MSGSGKKNDNNSMLNPKLGFGFKVILGLTILLFYGGIQGGIIGGVTGGIVAWSFYYVAIRLLAKYKKVELMVNEPLLTREETAIVEKNGKARVKFWTIFLGICGVVLL